MTPPPPAIAFWAALVGDPIDASNWPQILQRARKEGVLPLVAALHPSCPDRSSIRREAAIAHLSRVTLYRRVTAILASTGIPWVAVKGLAAAVLLYADPSERPSGDCDILVRPGDRRTAADALIAAGFRPTPHHAELFVGDEGEVDLHTHAVNRERVPARARLRITEPDWLARRRTIPTEAGPLPVLDDGDLAVFLALHLVHHHGGLGARWLVDLHRLVKSCPEAAHRLERGEAGRAGFTALLLVRSLWHDAGRASTTPGLLDRITLSASRDGEDIPGLRFLHTLRELPIAARLAFLRETLVPARDILDAVAVPRATSPLPLHLRRLAQTAFSITRRAWQAVHSGP